MAELVTLARPYAKAAFEVACADQDLSGWQNMLNTLGSVVSDRKMQIILAAPALTHDSQAAVLLSVCGDALNEKVKNLVHVLAANKRLSLLKEIACQFSALKAQREKIVEVEISSAFVLDPAIAERLSLALGKKWQCQVKLETHVDSALLGGAIIKAGDTVIDASVRGRLYKLAEAINS